MSHPAVHNPDRYIADLRQILSQGRKRVGLLIGAGASVSVRVDKDGKLDSKGDPLIPDVARLTHRVLSDLSQADRIVVDKILLDLDQGPNIEAILTRVRRLSQAIGSQKVYGLSGPQYQQLSDRICEHIGAIVGPKLPKESNAFTQLVSWIGGTHRDHPVELFTPNYDLLLEEAFERGKLPYFDGFTGAHKPFFDPPSIGDSLSPRWSRLWKLHGSLGWEIYGDTVIRTGSRKATNLIYPEHLKYDQISRQPFSALFERLREFLKTPDSLLICTGFSFSDAHITSVLDECLASNAHTAVLAFQFGSLENETQAKQLAHLRPNLSVYARNGAIIFGIEGAWQLGEPPTKGWESIRSTFWEADNSGNGQFLLGDFSNLAFFVALAQAENIDEDTGDVHV